MVSVSDNLNSGDAHSGIQAHHSAEPLDYDGYVPSKTALSVEITEPVHQITAEKMEESVMLYTSRWKIGWKVPVATILFYGLALPVAVLNLIMFQILDGKRSDEQSSFPQAYVTSVAILLANTFQACLAGALAIAFTQHLWRVFRISSLTVSEIDLLHRIRREVLSLLYPKPLVSASLLYAMALLIWLLSVIKIFPPGALTVTSRPSVSVENSTLSTYDPSYLRNRSFYAADYLSTNIFWPGYRTNTRDITALGYTGLKSSILQIAVSTLTSGDVLAPTSPCGANCSYTTTFEGPYLLCTDHTHNETTESGNINVYEGAWNGDPGPQGPGPETPSNFADFQVNLTSPVGAFGSSGSYPSGIFYGVKGIVCQPSRAAYTLNVTFVNGQRTLSHTVEYSISIQDTFINGYVNATCPPGGLIPDNQRYLNDVPLIWDTQAFQNFATLNIYGFIDCLVSVLTGAYPTAAGHDDIIIGTYTLPDGTVVLLYRLSFGYHTSSSAFQLVPSQTLLRVNVFNQNRDLLVAGPSFNITQDRLNEALTNITIGTMLTLGYWTSPTDAITTTYINVYSFSKPFNLLLPYFIPLLIVPVFLAIGANSLRLNGVPAMDDGFVQLLMTTTGSRALKKAAAAGCLGGAENIPAGLKKLKVRYGELITEPGDAGVVKRAGFGVEGEVRSLRRGALYGIDT